MFSWVGKIFRFVRCNFKRICARYMLIHEYCHLCGIRQPLVWKVSDDLWHKVVGSSEGVRCPKCFEEQWRGKFKGILKWSCSQEVLD